MKTKAPLSAPPPARSRPFSRRLLQPLGFAVHGFSPPAPAALSGLGLVSTWVLSFLLGSLVLLQLPTSARGGGSGPAPRSGPAAWTSQRFFSCPRSFPTPSPIAEAWPEGGGPCGCALDKQEQVKRPLRGALPSLVLVHPGRSQHRRVRPLELWVCGECWGGALGPIFTYKENF